MLVSCFCRQYSSLLTEWCLVDLSKCETSSLVGVGDVSVVVVEVVEGSVASSSPSSHGGVGSTACATWWYLVVKDKTTWCLGAKEKSVLVRACV